MSKIKSILLICFLSINVYSQIEPKPEKIDVIIPVKPNNVMTYEEPLARDIILKYTGTYEITPEYKFEIFTYGNKMYFKKIGEQQKYELHSSNSHLFWVNKPDYSLIYYIDNEQFNQILLNNMSGKKIIEVKEELFDEILKADMQLNEVFNHQDEANLKNLFAKNFELYHNLDGSFNGTESLNFFKNKYFEKQIRKKTITNSVEIFPIDDNGALEIGKQEYYTISNGKEVFISTNYFIHTWKKEKEVWKIRRLVDNEIK